MRLQKYLTEVESVKWEEIKPEVEAIIDECSKISAVYKKAGSFIYRGIKDFEWIIEKQGRGAKVRIPRNTRIEVHRFFNKIFKEKLGWKVRDGISTTPQAGWADFYGNPYIFFPTDRYKFAWSPKYGDLYNDFPVTFTVVPGSFKKFLESKKTAFVRAVNTYKTDDLVGAIHNGKKARVGEIMFKVGKYYLINAQLENNIKEILGI